jgi:hypothetical protein
MSLGPSCACNHTLNQSDNGAGASDRQEGRVGLEAFREAEGAEGSGNWEHR